MQKVEKKQKKKVILHSHVILFLILIVTGLAFFIFQKEVDDIGGVSTVRNIKKELSDEGKTEDKTVNDKKAEILVENEVVEKEKVTKDASTETKKEDNNQTPSGEKTIPVKEINKKSLDYTVGISMAETLVVVDDDMLGDILNDVVSLGVGWIRIDVAWSSVQPNNKDEYFWENTDRIVNEASKRGLRVLPIITYTPYWARSDKCKYTNRCAPDSPLEFAKFAKDVASRYSKKGVHAYEIWNEPNLGLFWKPSADPEYYVRLLKGSYVGIHEVDPSAIVITGGLAPTDTKGISMSPREFVELMYKYGGKNYFDAVGFHPYSFPVSPDEYHKTSAWSHMNDTNWSLRSIMKKNGDNDKNIWLTEYGAPTGGSGSVAEGPGGHYIWNVPDHVTEKYQSEILESAIVKTREYEWDGPMFWYSYKDLGTDTSTKENFFGLLRHDGSKKPAYFTLKRLEDDRIITKK